MWCRLEEQSDPEPDYLVRDVAEFPAGLEQLIDLGTNAFGGGHSS